MGRSVKILDLRLKEHLETFKLWADQGHLPSIYLVALAFLRGNGVPKDNDKARSFGKKGVTTKRNSTSMWICYLGNHHNLFSLVIHPKIPNFSQKLPPPKKKKLTGLGHVPRSLGQRRWPLKGYGGTVEGTPQRLLFFVVDRLVWICIGNVFDDIIVTYNGLMDILRNIRFSLVESYICVRRVCRTTDESWVNLAFANACVGVWAYRKRPTKKCDMLQFDQNFASTVMEFWRTLRRKTQVGI